MVDTAVSPAVRARVPVIGWRLLWMLLALTLGVRLVYAALLPLIPDEAFYWVWTRHLSSGYFDHPPMIAWLIWLGIHAAGANEVGVRLLGALMSIGTTLVIVFLARRTLRDDRATMWVAILWLTSPLLAMIGLLATPDMPSIFFSTCALACATIIAERDDQSRGRNASASLWGLFGLFSGLGLVSKYPAVLLPAGVALAMLFSARGRAHFRRPWIYLAGVVAVLVFSPVIWWNAHHHWASFLFQLHHGTDVDEEAPDPVSVDRWFYWLWHVMLRAASDLATYVGGQLFTFTPILFVLALVVLVVYWRRHYSPLGRTGAGVRSGGAEPALREVDRVWLWTATLPLAFFGLAMLRAHHYELNWPAFAYFPLSLLIGRWLSERWDGARANWAKGGCELALAMLIGLHVVALPPVLSGLQRIWPWRLPHALQATSWREYGARLGEQARDAHAVVIANRHTDAGEASFYMPGRPEVWCIGVGSRPTAFDYFDLPPDLAKIPRVLWVGGHVELFRQTYGYRMVGEPKVTKLGRAKRPRILLTTLLERAETRLGEPGRTMPHTHTGADR